jgi:hypothetical protein
MARSLYRPARRVKDISKKANTPHISHGRLAEDYDGIGQYVLVSLSHAGTSAAYKARIAPGDFGTGQVIPAGTPVSIFSFRGQIEILSLGAK